MLPRPKQGVRDTEASVYWMWGPWDIMALDRAINVLEKRLIRVGVWQTDYT
jgi:hypothetical protein